MASVVVPAAVLFGDGLPDICFRTGQPTSRRMRVTFSTLRHPWAVVILLLLSPLAAFVGWFILARQAHGSLAATDAVFAQRRRAQQAVAGVAAAGVLALGIGLVAGSVVLIVLAVLWLAVAPAVAYVLLRRTYQPHGEVFDDGAQRLVRLENVHPAFVAAVTAKAPTGV